MKISRYILFCLLAAVVCLTSCSKKERVIPRGKMAKIYAEMFITDQKLQNAPSKVKSTADTSYVYEPIFEKYGYTSDDYRASIAYYIEDATRFARILKQSALIIEGEIKDLKRQKVLQEMMEQAEGSGEIFIPERIYNLTGVDNPCTFLNDSLKFLVDSSGGERWFDTRTWMDTAYYGPVMVLLSDTLSTADSLSAADSLASSLDSLKAGETVKGATASDSSGSVSQSKNSRTRQSSAKSENSDAVVPQGEAIKKNGGDNAARKGGTVKKSLRDTASLKEENNRKSAADTVRRGSKKQKNAPGDLPAKPRKEKEDR